MTTLARLTLASLLAAPLAAPILAHSVRPSLLQGDPARTRTLREAPGDLFGDEGFWSYRRSTEPNSERVHVHLALLGTPDQHLARPDSGLARALGDGSLFGDSTKTLLTWEQVAGLPIIEVSDLPSTGSVFASRALWFFTDDTGRTLYVLAGMPDPRVLNDAVDLARALAIGARGRTAESERALLGFHRECRELSRQPEDEADADWIRDARTILWRPGGIADQAKARARIAARADLTKVRIELPVKAAVEPLVGPVLERQARLHAILLARPDARPPELIAPMFRDALDLDPEDDLLGLVATGPGHFQTEGPFGRTTTEDTSPWWPARTFVGRIYERTAADGSRDSVRVSFDVPGAFNEGATASHPTAWLHDPGLRSQRVRSLGQHPLALTVEHELYGALAFEDDGARFHVAHGLDLVPMGSIGASGFQSAWIIRHSAKGPPKTDPFAWFSDATIGPLDLGRGAPFECLVIRLARRSAPDSPLHRVWLARGLGPVRWERYFEGERIDTLELVHLDPSEPR